MARDMSRDERASKRLQKIGRKDRLVYEKSEISRLLEIEFDMKRGVKIAEARMEFYEKNKHLLERKENGE